MRTLWTAGAAIVVFVVTASGIGALGHSPSPVQTSPPLGSTHSPAEVAWLTVEVSGLVGMEGLALAGGLDRPTISGREYYADVLQTPIGSSPFLATDRVALGPGGAFGLMVFAGEPPCRVVWVPSCGLSTTWSRPEYLCSIEFDALPGEDIHITIAGLPAFEMAAHRFPACPVSQFLREPITLTAPPSPVP
jgi:hypothetical protein